MHTDKVVTSKGLKVGIAVWVCVMVIAVLMGHRINTVSVQISAEKPILTRNVYVGRNPSMEAKAITGSTIHVEYPSFIKVSHAADRTFVLGLEREEDRKWGLPVYALARGYVYKTVLPFPGTEDYLVESRQFTSDGNLKVTWRRLEPWFVGRGYYTVCLLVACLLGLLASYETKQS